MDKQQWIDEVLQSTNGMQRAMPKEGLYENIVSNLDKKREVATTPIISWGIAAAIALLFINFGSMFMLNKKTNNNSTFSNTQNQIEVNINTEVSYDY